MNEVKNSDNYSEIISPDSLKTDYVTAENCRFFETPSGFLGAEINGNTYRRVILSRALPLTMPDKYICITDVEKNELGIIEDISYFTEEQQKLINGELSQRYFCPVITEILSIKEKFGNFYFDVKIGNYKKNFTVKNLNKNIRYHGEGFDLIDVDGSRYRILDFDKFPSKSRRKLEPYIY
ncbi:MAG: DUF1854 domain-containing protein [Clostridia bacterium]|nr:DUF1854 domain-containing protein [Clostridia bacterium]